MSQWTYDIAKRRIGWSFQVRTITRPTMKGIAPEIQACLGGYGTGCTNFWRPTYNSAVRYAERIVRKQNARRD